MKFWLIAVLSVAFGSLILASPVSHSSQLGSKECTWGPTHWCKNLTNAKNCNAVKHCIQTVWEHQTLPEDTDNVCQICLDMVKQARDQLESNETQDDLRAVFEGSCKLMYIKPIVKECIVVVDNFIPELIEALASQMNPQVVCSVAGLCNNAHIDKLLEENKEQNLSNEGKKFTCGKCSSISATITTKFHTTSRDKILENMLEMCGQMGSFSDACSSILLTYFADIYQHLSENLTPDAVCHMAGACAGKYHQHSEEQQEEIVEVRPMSDVGFVDVQDPDIPCELCEQLVNHLRDLLTANTTELEFKDVLEGLCGQTKGFKAECLSIVDQYYAEIYEFVTKNLDSKAACFYIGVCPKGLQGEKVKTAPIAPLVPFNVQLPQKKLLGQNEPKFTEEEINSFQLPIERLAARPIDKIMGAPNSKKLNRNGSWCTLCEYAMHFVQEELANEKNEEQLKTLIEGSCHKMPAYLRAECDNFVELYGDAILALLIQEIDPATICPEIHLCPSREADSEVFAPDTIHVQINAESTKGKGSCPLCLLAVQQAKEVIENDKTEEKVKDTLKNLCSHLKNKKLNLECQDFVDTYSKELVELLVRDFTPQEICSYLKLCTDSRKPVDIVIKSANDQAIETNEIGDNTIDGIMFSTNNQEPVVETPECMLCKDIIKEVERRVQNRTSKADIKHALDHACDKIPRKARDSCHNYVNKYGDRIADLIKEEMSPKEICRDLQLCLAAVQTDLDVDDAIHVTVFTSPAEPKAPVKSSQMCILCEMIVARMDKDLKNPANQAEVKHYLDMVCTLVPKAYRKECDNFIAQYAQLIIETVDHIPPKALCTDIQACSAKMSPKEKDDVLDCAVCNGAVSALDTLLKEKSIDDNIESFLEESCHAVSGRYYERCLKLVKVYGISMIEQLKQKLETDKVCVNIGMCYSTEASAFVQMSENSESDEEDSDEDSDEVDEIPAVKTKQFLVGESECTWGPTHWCKDEETAKKCGSVDFCKKKSLGKWSA